MKRLKFLLAFAFLLVGTLTALAFTSDSYHKVIGSTCLKWNKSEDPTYNNRAQLLDPANWVSMSAPPLPDFYNTCNGIDELCAICFQAISTTPAQARGLLYNYFEQTGYFPPNTHILAGPNGQRTQVYLKMWDIDN